MSAAKNDAIIVHLVTTTVTKTTTTDTVMIDTVEVTELAAYPQTQSTAVVAATRRSIARHGRTATEAKSIGVATAPDHLELKTSTRTTRST